MMNGEWCEEWLIFSVVSFIHDWLEGAPIFSSISLSLRYLLT